MKKISHVMSAILLSSAIVVSAVHGMNQPEQQRVLKFIPPDVYPVDMLPVPGQSLEPQLLYRVDEKTTVSERDRECVLKNIFHEARGEPIEGKIAVAEVTFNRLRDGRWGESLCSVVYARSQFSWTLDKRKLNSRPGGPMWEESKRALAMYLRGIRVVELNNSTHFHATWMKRRPGWAKVKTELITIGQHTFYASLR